MRSLSHGIHSNHPHKEFMLKLNSFHRFSKTGQNLSLPSVRYLSVRFSMYVFIWRGFTVLFSIYRNPLIHIWFHIWKGPNHLIRRCESVLIIFHFKLWKCPIQWFNHLPPVKLYSTTAPRNLENGLKQKKWVIKYDFSTHEAFDYSTWGRVYD